MQRRIAKRVLASLSTATLTVGAVSVVEPAGSISSNFGPSLARAQTQDDPWQAQIRRGKITLSGLSWSNLNDTNRSATIEAFDLVKIRNQVPSNGKLPPDARFTWKSGTSNGVATAKQNADGTYRFELFDANLSKPVSVTVTATSPLVLEPIEFTSEQMEASLLKGGPYAADWIAAVKEKPAQPDPAWDTATGECIVRDEIRGATVYASRTEGNQTVLYTQQYGQTGFTRVGSQLGKYNALAVNPKDGYLYAITQNGTATPSLIRVDALDGSYQTIGPINGFDDGVTSGAKHFSGRLATGADDAKGGITNGAFTNDGDFIFANNSQSGTGIVYAIPAADLEQIPEKMTFQAQRRDTQFDGNRPTGANDYATVGFEPTQYMWSVTASMEGNQGRVMLIRSNTNTGKVDTIDITNLQTLTGQRFARDGVYGNAWTFGNGNLGFTRNNSELGYQLAVAAQDADLAGLSNEEKIRRLGLNLVSVEAAPTSYNNDAASNSALIKERELKSGVNLSVTKTPITNENGQVAWRVIVKNQDDCESSGFSVHDVIPGNTYLKNSVEIKPETDGWLNAPEGAVADLENLNLTHGALAPGEEASLVIAAERNATGVCVSNWVTVIGLEEDPDETNNTASDQLCEPELEIKKYINGEDADSVESAANVTGDSMTIKYVVKNNGPAPVYNVKLEDVVESGPDADMIQKQITGELTDRVIPKIDEKGGAADQVEIEFQVNLPSGDNRVDWTDGNPHLNRVVARGVAPDWDDVNTPADMESPFAPPPVESNEDPAYAKRVEPPVVVDPEFAIEKFRVEAGAINLAPKGDGDYAFSTEYIIRVRNTSEVDGAFPEVRDVPVVGDGFTVDAVKVDATDVEPNEKGEYFISGGDDLAAGAVKDYRVTVSGTVAGDAANTLPEAVGQCDADGQDPAQNTGLVNEVTMEGDSDGPENNVVCTPAELRRLNIEKRIDGREEAVVKPGEKMELWYRVRNTGNTTLTGIKIADQIKEDDDELQKQINDKLADVVFDLAPGAVHDVRIEVDSPKGAHENEAQAIVPPTTIPGTTGPETTIPEREIPGTTVSTTANANSPKLEIKKYINGFDDAADVVPGEDMEILYRVSNTGQMRVDDIKIVDEVTEGAEKDKLQQEINTALEAEPAFSLEPGSYRDIRITVEAPAGGHHNVANVSVPPTTIPGSEIPGTTNPHTTVPGTSVPSKVVTVTAPPDDARSNSPKLDIKKVINGYDDGDVVKPGDEVTITYIVANTGTTPVKGVTIADEVTEAKNTSEWDEAIQDQLKNVEAFDLAAGEVKEVEIELTAPGGYHVNVARPVVPPVTVPPVTIPETTIPGTTNSVTTIPGTVIPSTTRPGRVISPTATPSDDARSDELAIAIEKDIFSVATGDYVPADNPEDPADAALVADDGKMQIRYKLTNTGSVDLNVTDIEDKVTEYEGGDANALTAAIKEQIDAYFAEKSDGIVLKPGEEQYVSIEVDAPKGRHVNVANPVVPPLTTTRTVVTPVPGTTVPGTTNPETTVPATTLPPSFKTETTVVETAPSTPSNTAHATPTTSDVPAPVDPQFAVEKLGNQSGISLERNEDGNYAYSASYTVRVRNTGTVAGEHAKVQDVPVRGVGFDIDSVTVDGTEVAPSSGTYLISDGAELGVGEYKDYEVVVAGTMSDESADALPAAVGQCDAVTPGNPGAGSGLVNTVQLSLIHI